MAVHKLDCETMIAACRPNLHFGIMFQQRLSPVMRKLKDLVGSGELGRITRVNWIITNWFRSDRYYAGGGWRGTWAGEGGGVLMNQCPHNLDLLQWICGMPVRVHAHVGFGKWHKDIEVEDEVTAYLEYANGATGVFITTTAEAPGVNRFEICGENGQLVAENGELRYRRNRVSALEFLRTTKEAFSSPEVWDIRVPLDGTNAGHDGITQNFVDAILKGVPLVAPGAEGIRQVELGSAMLQSGITGKTVELPLDGRAFKRMLQRLIRESKGKPRAGS
jgi:predicted dehydrogenase